MKLIIFGLLFFNLYAGIPVKVVPGPYVDFGEEGKVYEILEPDINDYMYKKIANFKFDKEEIRNELIKGVDKLAKFEPNEAKICMQSKIYDWENNYFEIQNDFYNPLGRLIYKKGEKILSPSVPTQKNICLIEGKILLEAKNQMDYFLNIDKDCVFLVSNRDVREIQSIYPDAKLYPGNEMIFKRFHIEYTSGIISFKDTKIRKEYISIEKFK